MEIHLKKDTKHKEHVCTHVHFQLTGSDSLSTAVKKTALANSSRSKDKRLLNYNKIQLNVKSHYRYRTFEDRQGWRLDRSKNSFCFKLKLVKSVNCYQNEDFVLWKVQGRKSHRHDSLCHTWLLCQTQKQPYYEKDPMPHSVSAQELKQARVHWEWNRWEF